MKDLGEALLNKLDDIIAIWVTAVRADTEIDSLHGLTYEAVHNGLPYVLESVATLLTAAFADEEKELKEDALEHGNVRAEQGFDLPELIREYRILRNVLLSELTPELETGSVKEVLKAVKKIDSVLDEVVLISLKSYMDQRLSMLEQMHGQLVLTNQELSRLVEIQKDNVSHLAHELKNPLHSIISFSSILLRKQRQQLDATADNTPIEVQQIERIFNNGRQLLRLINNTLEASKADAEAASLSLETVKVSALIKNVVDALSPSVASDAIRLEMNCEQGPETVVTDSLRLQQILTNLISNAIRYTDKGSITVIAYLVSDTDWAIAVKDTGRGIAKVDQSKVFEPYFQSGDEKSWAVGSNGLGLTIVSKLVRRLQGRIELDSELGKGSTFTVVLPCQLSKTAAS
ncbi:MAG: sensor histidine kinase [Cyanobacteria bacterium J06634_6]